MIEILCNDTLFLYNVYHMTKAFFPEYEILQRVEKEQEPLVQLRLEGGSCFSILEEDVPESEKERAHKKQFVTKQVYNWLSKQAGRELAWGQLTGVRPTKLAMLTWEELGNPKDAIAYFQEEYGVSEKKAVLSMEIAQREKQVLAPILQEKGYSLYIGIPFCPTICSYCSFGSAKLADWADRMDLYLDALCKELTAIATATKGRRLHTIYIGGGTPTTLTAWQLERLLSHVASHFSMEHLLEYTIEAGRPDTITREKLACMKRYPVTRLSINPQTMQQKTLDLVGRGHLVSQVYEAFEVARELGFDHINMDLIAGLPEETLADMLDTLRQIEELGPDSLTVHALSIKRAAKMGQAKEQVLQGQEIEQMIEACANSAKRLGLVPYYLYRQKNIAGNFENVGYAKVDKAGIYNILIMEEKETIFAAGAGSTTKIVLPAKEMQANGKETNLVRIENVKEIGEYIRRIDEMIERKEEWLWR
jgi:oxygen-independent coproporphyrinogen-3 oxidase